MNRGLRSLQRAAGVTLAELLVALSLLALLLATATFFLRGSGGCGRGDALAARGECDALAGRLMARLRDDLRSSARVASAGDAIELALHGPGATGEIPVRYEIGERAVVRIEGAAGQRWDFSAALAGEGSVGLTVVRRGEQIDAELVVRSARFPEPVRRRERLRAGTREAAE